LGNKQKVTMVKTLANAAIRQFAFLIFNELLTGKKLKLKEIFW